MNFYPLILGATFTLLILGGFVVDQAGQLEMQQQAQTIAQGAARAGTNAATGNAINGDAFDLAPQTAIAAAQNYVAAAGPEFSSDVSVQGGEITVTVRTNYQTRAAQWVGVTELGVSGAGSARLIDGNLP